MIIILVGIVLIVIIGRLIAKWATKDIADVECDKQEFNVDNVYYNNYTQGKK